MLGFVEWLDKNPFYVSQTWDYEKNDFGGPGRLVLSDTQRRIFSHCLQPNEVGKLPYDTILFSAIKKSGKTTLEAAIVNWANFEFPDGSETYILTNSREQSEARCLTDLKFHAKRYNAHLGKDGTPIYSVQYKLTYPNDSFVTALSKSYDTPAGGRHALTVWDELWGYTGESDRRLWEEMTPVPTVPNSIRFVATYAGFVGESDLLWNLYINGVGVDENEAGRGERIPGLEDLPCWRNAGQFTYWDHLPRMPWQTAEYYRSQRGTLRPAAYLRLHENRWVTTSETFIPIEWWERAEKAHNMQPEYMPDNPYRDYPMFLGVDAGQKHDTLAVVGCTYDPVRSKVIQVFHKIWVPSKGEVLDLEETLEAYLLEKYRKYKIRSIHCDPALLVQMIVKLKKKGLPISEFTQSDTNMIESSQSFYDLLRYNNYECYPDEEVRQQIINTLAIQKGRGFRLTKAKDRTTLPMDFSIAAAIASYMATIGMASVHTEPRKIAATFSDQVTMPPDEQLKLPFELRD